jgi:hypothetical protein
MKRLLLAGFALVSACNALPRDPAGTSSRVARGHSFRIGFADADAAGDPQAASLVKKLEAATHAKAIIVDGAGEVLLKHLADGDVDVPPWQLPRRQPVANRNRVCPAFADQRQILGCT